jgi:hypothetical protein
MRSFSYIFSAVGSAASISEQSNPSLLMAFIVFVHSSVFCRSPFPLHGCNGVPIPVRPRPRVFPKAGHWNFHRRRPGRLCRYHPCKQGHGKICQLFMVRHLPVIEPVVKHFHDLFGNEKAAAPAVRVNSIWRCLSSARNHAIFFCCHAAPKIYSPCSGVRPRTRPMTCFS